MKALVVEDLKKTYKNGFTALKGINLSVEEGDFFALLGPNGAGKSTLIGVISSLVNKTHGSVRIFDKDLATESEMAKSYLGLVPQEYNLSIFSKVEHIVLHQAGYYGVPKNIAKQRAEKYLKQLELWDKRNEQVRMLSGGMKRRLMIARALMHEPRMLILDEPTAGVDIEIRRSMWEFLREINRQGVTIILTTHYLEEAENLCRNIAIIDHGHIIENTGMQALLSKLTVETFVFYLQQPLQAVPEVNGFATSLIDPNILEVDISDTQNMNDLFVALTKQNIIVKRMRNKFNRLEELFMRLIADSKEARNAKA